MNNINKIKPASSAEQSVHEPTALVNVPRKHRKVSPLGFRVLVRIQKEENVSEGGLYLPEGSKQSMDESVLGEVIEVASATETDSDDETNISGIPLGATVLIPKHSGVRVPWDNDLRIVSTKEVLAIVDQVSLD